MRSPRPLVAFLSLALLPAAAAVAGPLDPPAGPVAPTMKSLAQVEPRTPIGPETTPGVASALYRITQPGSYYLTGDVLGVSGRSCIRVEASSVTIDLNGFTVRGVSGSHQGIETTGPEIEALEVRNGRVEGWGQTGIILGQGGRSRVVNVTVLRCGGPGIVLGANNTALGCTSSDNVHTGIIATANCIIRDCTACGNTLHGIFMGDNSVVEGCTARDNGGAGITAAGRAVVRGSVAIGNGGDGIAGGNSPAVSEITGCVARSNALSGIRVVTHSRVADCFAAYNGEHGIAFNTICVVTGNTCISNGQSGQGAGIYGLPIPNGRTLVEGNTCTQNVRGIQLDSANNLVIRNACTLNTVNFEMVANNRVGTIVVAPVSGAISGNTGAAGTGATDPMANFGF